MSVSKWAYNPDLCDGEPCVGECDICGKIEAALEEENSSKDGLPCRVECSPDKKFVAIPKWDNGATGEEVFEW